MKQYLEEAYLSCKRLNEDVSSDDIKWFLDWTSDLIKGKSNFVVEGNSKDKKFVIVFPPKISEQDIMSQEMIGDILQRKGFNLSLETKDVPIKTHRRTFGGGLSPDTKYLRNRVVMTVTW